MKKPRPRSALLLTCLPLLVLMAPAGASAAVEVAPPGTEAGGAYTSAAATDDGCSSTNRVRFRQEDPLPPSFRVRHLGRMVCGVPTRIRCGAALIRVTDTPRTISEISGRGRDRCGMASRYGASREYPSGERFRERFRYRLTLRRKSHRWASTTAYCPERRRGRRVLICRDAFSTRAPKDRSVTHE